MLCFSDEDRSNYYARCNSLASQVSRLNHLFQNEMPLEQEMLDIEYNQFENVRLELASLVSDVTKTIENNLVAFKGSDLDV